MSTLRLYVWREVCWDYTPGIAFALAEDVEQARELIIAESVDAERMRYELASAPEVFDSPVGFCRNGGG